MAENRETVQGYVVDLACLRAYPQKDILARSRKHTRACARMGHCIESGYALVDEGGRVAVLDSEATGKVVGILERSRNEEGIFLRAERESDGHKMKTVRVEESDPRTQDGPRDEPSAEG